MIRRYRKTKAKCPRWESKGQWVTPWELCPAFDRAWAARQVQGEDLHFHHLLVLHCTPGQLYIKLYIKYRAN